MGIQYEKKYSSLSRPVYLPGTDEEKNKESVQKEWSRRVDLNHRPSDYESLALPLSYAGLMMKIVSFFSMF